ncbi:MAG: AbrB/MazE/SpoVT family DNA-binding domain-containing protein [Candidatus Diapherotrites archaeon]
MVEVSAQVRRWGRSIGVVIPKDKALKARLKPGDEVNLLILEKKNPLKETFGILEFSRPTREILKETDKDAWDE